jgi:hypothetical protein
MSGRKYMLNMKCSQFQFSIARELKTIGMETELIFVGPTARFLNIGRGVLKPCHQWR